MRNVLREREIDMNANRGTYRRRNDNSRGILIGAIAVVLVAIAVVTFFIFAEIFGWFEKNDGNTKDPIGNITSDKFSATTIDVSSSDVHIGDLILINNTYKYVFPDIATTVVPILSDRVSHGKSEAGNPIYSFYTQTGEASCAKLESDTSKLFNNWTDAFYKATGNSDLFVYDKDGYRTESDEVTEHYTGKVIDLRVWTGKVIGNLDDAEFAETFKWIYDNAYKYGFVLRYPSEKSEITGETNERYHFRQVGYAHAYYMYKNNLCLEEYLDLLKTHNVANPLEFKGDDGNSYVVYYQAASEGTTKLTVPADLDYTVSGDNMGGFIVTVNLGK